MCVCVFVCVCMYVCDGEICVYMRDREIKFVLCEHVYNVHVWLYECPFVCVCVCVCGFV